MNEDKITLDSIFEMLQNRQYKELRANSASTERVFRYQLNIDSDCF